MEAGLRLLCDAGEDVGEPGLRVDVVEFGGADQRDGIGIGTLPRVFIEDQLADGSLVSVPCEWQPSDLDFTASFPTVPGNPISDAAVELAREISASGKRLVKHVNS